MRRELPARLGLLGDVHAEDARLATAIAWLRGRGVDALICVGDVADGYGDLDRAVALLEQHAVITVRGNHDRWLVLDEMRALPQAQRRSEIAEATLAFLRALPPTIELDTRGGRTLVCHGVDTDDMRRLSPDAFGYELETNDELQALIRSNRHSIAIGGHTHQRMARRFGGLVFVNPGTLHRDYESCFALLDTHARTIEYVELIDEREVLAAPPIALP